MRTALAVLGLACGLTACRAFDESLLDGGGADAGSSCMPRTPPERPMPVPTPGDMELLFALRDVRLEQGGDWRAIGYDLDGLCSVDPSPQVECHPPDEMNGLATDGTDGIDNAAGDNVFPFTLVLLGDLEAPVRQDEEMGRGVILLRLRGYNGEPDDDRVNVAIAMAAFGSPALPSGDPPELPPDGSAPPPPAWDGTDYWWGETAAFLGGDIEMPLVDDSSAYVSGSTLVVHPPDRSPLVFTAAGFSFELKLAGAVITAQITDGGTRLSPVTVAGRWRLLDIRETFPSFGLCPSSVNAGRMSRLLDQSADVRAGAPGATCDAISVGIELTGYGGRMAGVAAGPAPPVACP